MFTVYHYSGASCFWLWHVTNKRNPESSGSLFRREQQDTFLNHYILVILVVSKLFIVISEDY